VNLTASTRVYALGTIVLVAMTICSLTFRDRGGTYFMLSLTIAAIAYLLAVREFFANPTFPRRVVVIGLVCCAVWQIAFLRLAPGIDDDIHRYVWDGRIQRLGYNPYIVVPSDPSVKGLHTADTRSLNNPDLPSPYPPGAQLFFRAVTAIHESVFALKVAFLLCAWAIVFLLLDLLRCNRQGAHLVLVYAWNPLLAIEVAGSGHIDIVGVLLLMVSAVALARRWRTTAAIALAMAIAVKFLPIVLVPLYWKRVRFRDAALAAVLVAVLYVPFLEHGRTPTGSLGSYVQGFRFNGPVFALLGHVLHPLFLVMLAAFVGFGVACWLRSTPGDLASRVFAWPLAASLVCAPVIFPWYLLWLLPFLTSSSTLLLVIWTVSIIPTYIQWHLSKVSGVWGSLPLWVMFLEYGCLGLAFTIMVVRSMRRSAHISLPSEDLK
jgi:hypothetical protein